jgi:hypothetical protein
LVSHSDHWMVDRSVQQTADKSVERKGTHLEWKSVDSMELYLAECLELRTVEKMEMMMAIHWEQRLEHYLERNLVE